jgi:Peptidase MA superfamily
MIGMVFSHMSKTSEVNREVFDLVGAWVGHVNNHGDQYRMVFNIQTLANGELSGTLDSPDKGIEGIWLGPIMRTGSKVVIDIPVAGAQYEGKISKNNQNLVGQWTDPSGVYPIKFVLNANKIAIKPVSIPKQLTSLFETTHFKLYSSPTDSEVLEKVGRSLELFYSKLSKHLSFELKNPLVVLIYPDLQSFHKAINLKEKTDWVVGAASYNKLMFVSPLNPGKAHDFDSVVLAANHELVHTMLLNMSKNKLPRWFDEGIAYFFAGQLDKNQFSRVKELVRNKKQPTWAALAEFSSVEFGDQFGYPFSASAVNYLVSEFGYKKLSSAALDYQQIESIYGHSLISLEERWLKWILAHNTE